MARLNKQKAFSTVCVVVQTRSASSLPWFPRECFCSGMSCKYVGFPSVTTSLVSAASLAIQNRLDGLQAAIGHRLQVNSHVAFGHSNHHGFRCLGHLGTVMA